MPAENQPELYVGLMSGTSLNSIDAALVEFHHNNDFQLLHTLEYTLDPVREDILGLCFSGENEIHRMAMLDRKLGQKFAEATLQLLKQSGHQCQAIKALGSHGQTIRHKPGGDDGPAYSWQIGDPNTIAELTGIKTVADFRRRDISATGQGAPLACAFHQFAFQSPNEDRCIVNIGGISNISYLPRAGEVSGFDTGPGNMLLNEWISRHKSLEFDHQGAWARSGNPLDKLLNALLDDAYFRLPPPKSSGRELFNTHWLNKKLTQYDPSGKARPEDVMRTLNDLTAHSIAMHIKKYCGTTHSVFIAGGGAHNCFLLESIRALLPTSTVMSTEILGLNPDWVEAVCFAWLARQRLLERPGNLASVTGAKGPRILGGIYA